MRCIVGPTLGVLVALSAACSVGEPDSSGAPEQLYGQEAGLECHATEGDWVGTAIYDYGEGKGYGPVAATLDQWWGTEESSAAAERKSLTERRAAAEVTYTDEHGHVQVVLELGRENDQVRIEQQHTCPAG